MKNATKHADELKSLLKRLSRDLDSQTPQKLEPLKALVRGAMSYGVSDEKAEGAMKLIDREFVDLNELRVATELEVQELLGVRYPAIEQRVTMITAALNAIFEKEHTLKLDRLATISKRDARQFLRDLPEMNPFVEAYVMLFGLEGPAVPMDEQMVAYLKEEEVLEGGATIEEAQRFVEHQLKGVQECFDCYRAIRRAAGDEKRKKKG